MPQVGSMDSGLKEKEMDWNGLNKIGKENVIEQDYTMFPDLSWMLLPPPHFFC